MAVIEDTASLSWVHGLGFAIVASMIGAGSKLCIRRSYTILEVTDDNNKILMIDDSEENNRMHHHSSTTNAWTEVSDEDNSKDDDRDIEDTEQVFQFNDDEKSNSFHSHDLVAAFLLRGIGVLGMTVLSPMCNVYALQFASPSILSPVGGGLTLIWIILLSEYTIGERPSATQLVAVGIIAFSEVVVAFTGDHTNLYSIDVQTLERQYSDPLFLSYFACMILWVVLLVHLSNNGDATLRRFSWGVIGGSITGMQNFIKDALAVLHYHHRRHENNSSSDDENQDYYYPFQLYLLLGMAGIISLTGLLLLMACMKRYDATYSSSMYLGSTVLSASIMSAVHYHTFHHLTTIIKTISYITGLFILLIGCVILATTKTNGKNNKLEKQQQSNKITTTTTTTNGNDHNNTTFLLSGDKREYGIINN